MLPAWTVTFASSRLYRSARAKKPLAYTNRLKRLIGGCCCPYCPLYRHGSRCRAAAEWTGGVMVLSDWLFHSRPWDTIVGAAGCLCDEANRSRYPSNGFKQQARQHLQQRPDLTVVGITGSYGKTSTKVILAEILRQRYNVLATPASYNTPMGLCLVVNNRLKPEHQVLVLEMGMRYPGDIRELCDLAPPDLAVVTSVGVAHLETMDSIENIAREKGDLLTNMRPVASLSLTSMMNMWQRWQTGQLEKYGAFRWKDRQRPISPRATFDMAPTEPHLSCATIRQLRYCSGQNCWAATTCSTSCWG